jgi:hypothetical protein
MLDKLIVNKVLFFIENFFSFLYLFLIELRTYQRQTLCGVLTKFRFLEQDFNGSRFFGLDAWLSWVDFNLFVGSKGISSCGFTSWRVSARNSCNPTLEINMISLAQLCQRSSLMQLAGFHCVSYAIGFTLFFFFSFFFEGKKKNPWSFDKWHSL